jgi:hypothetical protein
MGMVWTSDLSIVTVWVWELATVDVNVFAVPGSWGVVESEQLVKPATSMARNAAQATAVNAFLGTIWLSPSFIAPFVQRTSLRGCLNSSDKWALFPFIDRNNNFIASIILYTAQSIKGEE